MTTPRKICGVIWVKDVEENKEDAAFCNELDLAPRRVRDVPSKLMEGNRTVSGYQVRHADDRTMHGRMLEHKLINMPVRLLMLNSGLAKVRDEGPNCSIVLQATSLSITLSDFMAWEDFLAFSDCGLGARVQHGPLFALDRRRRLNTLINVRTRKELETHHIRV